MIRTSERVRLGTIAASAVVLLMLMGSMVAPVATATVSTNGSTASFAAANAGNTVSVSLDVAESDGTPAANDEVAWESSSDYAQDQTNSSGVASASLTENDTYHVTYEQYGSSVDYPKDGTPDLFAVGTRTYENNTSESLTLPEGHNLSVTVINESGAPLSNVTVYVDQEREDTLASVNAETNSSGVLVDPNSDGPGFEVNGTVGVYVDSPTGNYDDNFTELSVNSDRDYTVVLEEVVNASGTARYPNGTVAENVTLRFRSDSDFAQAVTNSNGEYTTRLLKNESYEVNVWQANLDEVQNFSEPNNVEYPRDGVADFAALGYLNTSTIDVYRNFSFPVGNHLNVTVENESGAPIENASVGLTNERRGTHAFAYSYIKVDGLPTDSFGQMYHPPNTGVGMEVNGTTDVDVEPPENSSYTDNYTEVTVTSNRHVTVVLEEQVETAGRVRYPNGTVASNVTLQFLGKNDFAEVVTRADGTYQVSLAQNESYEVNVWQANLSEVTNRDAPTNVRYPRDGVADFASLGWFNTSSATHVTQNFSFPVGHHLDVTVENESGAPIENASVQPSNERNGTYAFMYRYLNDEGAPTDQFGRTYHPPNTGFGFEVNGTTNLDVEPPENSSYDANYTEFFVTSDRNVTVTLDRSVTVSGTIRYPNGTAAENVTLRLETNDGGPFDGVQVVTEPDGSYTATLEANRTYGVKIWQANLEEVQNPNQPTNVRYPRDGVADFAALDEVDTSTTGGQATRNFSFPVGHVLNVTVENESGGPIENASVSLSNERKGTFVSVYEYLSVHGLPTDPWGQMYHPPNTGVGLEVNGTTEIDVQPPQNTSYQSNFTTANVGSDRDVTVVLEKPDKVEGIWVGPNGNGIANADVWVINFSTGVIEQTTTDSHGCFNTSVPQDGTYSIYVNANQTGDGIADAWQVEGVSVNGQTNVGELMMPPGFEATLGVVDHDGKTVDAYVDVMGGNKGWIFQYQEGRQLDAPSQYDVQTRDLARGTHVVTIRDSWTHDVLAKRPITVLGNTTRDLAVDRYNGTRISGTADTTVARDLQSPENDETVQDVLNSTINVRLFVLNASSTTSMQVEEHLPAGYELDGTVANVSADGPGQLDNLTYTNGTLSFEVNGTITQVRYQAVPKSTPATSVEFSGRFYDTPIMGENALPEETDVGIFEPYNGSTVYTKNPFVGFTTRHPDATNVTKVEYRVDNGVWKEIEDVPAIGGAQLAGLDNGTHTVTIRLVNETGTVVTDSTTFNVSA